MKLIKEHISLFRKEATDRLIAFLRKNGKEISLRDFDDSPAINTVNGNCIVDTITLEESISNTSVGIEYNDTFEHYETNLDYLFLEDIVEIVMCLETHEEEIIVSSENIAIGLLGESYYEIFGEENGQTFIVDDLNIILENGTKITGISDWDGNGCPLFDENKIDHWNTISAGEKLRIAKMVYNRIMFE